MSELIIGGTSGLGLNIARLASEENDVIITGTHDPGVDFAEYCPLRFFLGEVEYLDKEIDEFIDGMPFIDSLVYSAGFFQDGRIDEIGSVDVTDMLRVGLEGLILAVQSIVKRQGKLDNLVTITSTSQWTPREFEPVYTAVKAGAAQFSNSMSLDERVGSTLVAAPSGMAGPDGRFWDKTDKDTSKMMPYDLVAKQVQHLRHSEYEELPLHEVDPDQPPLKGYSYCFAKILGATDALPQRVEIVETR